MIQQIKMIRIFKIKEDSALLKKAEGQLKKEESIIQANLLEIDKFFYPLKRKHVFASSGGFHRIDNVKGITAEESSIPTELPNHIKLHKDQKNVYVLNKRSKLGREFEKKREELPNVFYREVFNILGLKETDTSSRFTIADLFQLKDEFFLTLDQKDVDVNKSILSENFEEVTVGYVEKLQEV